MSKGNEGRVFKHIIEHCQDCTNIASVEWSSQSKDLVDNRELWEIGVRECQTKQKGGGVCKIGPRILDQEGVDMARAIWRWRKLMGCDHTGWIGGDHQLR